MLYSNSLAPLVRKIRDTHIETIVNTLATNMFSDSERLRDISSVGECIDISRVFAQLNLNFYL